MTGMMGDVLEVFHQQTAEFIKLELPSTEEMGVNVNILYVRVVEQLIISGGSSTGKGQGKTNSTRRFLQEEGLRVRMNVTGEITPGGPPDDFDFAQLVSMGFAKNYLVFAYRLSSADPFFDALLGDAARATSLGGGAFSADNKSKGATAGIVIACIAALCIACAAAFYAYKARDKRSRFQNPHVVTSSSGEFTGIEHASSRDMSIKSPVSPNTMENGKGLGIVRKYSMASSVASSPVGSIQSERILGIRAQAISPNNVETLMVGPSSKHTTIELDGGSGPPKDDDESLDAKLKKDVVMSLGGSGTNEVPVSQTEFSMLDDQSTIDANRKSSGPCCAAFEDFGNVGGMLGAQGRDQLGKDILYSSGKAPPAVKRSGLYEVFAPPGPLGIVVDTTKDGPVIHSLKASSALLGLVGSGDLIVGLDELDTRSMTAATLTRLMAKRSNQSERKITLRAV